MLATDRRDVTVASASWECAAGRRDTAAQFAGAYSAGADDRIDGGGVHDDLTPYDEPAAARSC